MPRRLSALLLFLALLVAGCGGGGGLPPAGSQAAPEALSGPPALPSLSDRPPAQALVPAPVAEGEIRGSLDLEAGWNMVAFPVGQLTGLEPGVGVFGSAFAWNPTAGSYEAVDLRTPASVATDRGYWVYSSQASQILYTGQGATGPDLTLGAGWNLLGLPYHEARPFSAVQVRAPGAGSSLQPLAASVSSLLPPPGPEVLLFASGYTFSGQAYQVLDFSSPSGSFAVGRATWVYVHQDGTLLRFAPPSTPLVSSTVLPEATTGSTYSAQLAAEQGRAPYTWTLVEGPLPPGVTLAADGALSGTPSADGTWYFLAQATDANGASAQAEVTLPVGTTAHVLVSEVLYDPPGTESNEEWVELYNPTSRPVDLSGWTLTDSTGTVQTATVDRGRVLPAHGTFVWARSGSTFQTLYGFAADQSSLNLSLANTGESVTLKDRSGAVVDYVGFELAGWPVAGTNTSIQRRSAEDTDTAADWEAAPEMGAAPGNPGRFPPGSANRAPVADAGPDLVVNAGDPATLDGSGTSDPDGDPLFLRWGPDLRGTRPTGSWTQPGVYDLVLSVADGSLFSLDRATVFVLEAGAPILGVARYNEPPRAHRLDTDLVALLDAATVSVEGAFYEVQRPAVVDALVRARGRGLTVRIATEADNYAASPASYAPLETAGVPIYQGATSGLTHDKFCVVDGQAVWTGSFNITDNDSVSNANDALLLRSTTLASAFSGEFAEFAAGRFGTQKTNSPPSEHLVDGRRVEAYFAPGGVRQPILEALASAQTSVEFCIFTFTDAQIREALLAKARAGVQVRGVLDATQAGSIYSAWNQLSVEPGVAVRKDDFAGFLHHKFLVVDAGTDSDPLVVTGSYNWTASAEDSNDENVVIVHDPGVALQYRRLFERRYATP